MKVPVLIYHDILSLNDIDQLRGSDRYYSLESGRFLTQLEYLAQNGFKTISLNDPISPGKKLVILTFDDGLKSHYDCCKLLRKYKFVGTFFIVSDFVGTEGYITWEQLKEMDEAGMNIQSHTCSHPFLTEINLKRLIHEFMSSKQTIEEKLEKQVDSISIPQGFVNKDLINIAVDCGYRYVYTSDPGIYNTTTGRIVKRLSIFNNTTIAEFKRLVSMNFYEIKKQKLYKHLLSLPKLILGTENYHRIRTQILKALIKR